MALQGVALFGRLRRPEPDQAPFVLLLHLELPRDEADSAGMCVDLYESGAERSCASSS